MPSTSGNWTGPAAPGGQAPGQSSGSTSTSTLNSPGSSSAPAGVDSQTGSYLPGNSGGAEATRPGGATQLPSVPTAPSTGSRPNPGASSSSTMPSTSGNWTGPAAPGGQAPGQSSGSTSTSTLNSPGSSSAPAGVDSQTGSYLPGNSGGAEAERPGSGMTNPSTPASPDSWGGSQGGTDPSSGLQSQERPTTPSQGRPDTSLSSGGSGTHTRPSTGSGGSSSSQGSSSGGHTRPSVGHQRPSTPSASGHPHRHHSTRPTTNVHHWYYGNRGPVVNIHHQRPVYWYHGVWVYGPRPAQHVYYNETTTVQPSERPGLPERKINRSDSFMIGVHGSQMAAGYDGGGSFVDPGVGVSFAYRPVETFSVGLDYSYFNPTMEDSATPRETANIAPNISIHAVPWKRVSPYAEFGMTASRRIYEDQWTQNGEQFETNVTGTAWGPHAGLGLEVAIGKSLALDLSGKYVGYVNVEGDDPSSPSALQGNLGLNIYF